MVYRNGKKKSSSEKGKQRVVVITTGDNYADKGKMCYLRKRRMG